MTVRIGFYVCHCGINIAGKVDVEEVAAFARGLKNVVVARDYKFMCSDPGQELIENDIREMGLTRVVVASCSPRFHEKTFQGACQRAGLNPYLFQMASVREQVSWVTADGNRATAKAKTLAAAAVNRVNHHQALETRQVGVHPDVMVVGGGIAGMQAALDVAASGHRVWLVERDTTIGGHMLQFDKTFPTLDCAACIGTPKMVEVAQSPHIQLLSYSEVTDVSGYIGNYTVQVRRKPRYVVEGACTGCGECAEVCPVSAPSEWNLGLSRRKAVYRAFPQAVPITFCIDKKDRAPCVGACPAEVNVQGYVQLIGQGKYQQAVELIMERLPLPGVLGRVCPRHCEQACRRLEHDQAVSIRDLKRFAADQVDFDLLERPDIVDRPEKTAVIGSGPAGLSAAYFLRREGYRVTLFESQCVLGGMLRTGIPDYRLPPEVLDREINHVLSLGIEVKTGFALGRDFTLDELREEGYSAVFLGLGAQGSLSLNLSGEEEAAGLIDALRFLKEVNLGRTDPPGQKTLIVGGGNVAVDAARSARRLGAEVTVVYRRTAKEMPAYPEEIEAAFREGVEFVHLASPAGLVLENGRVAGLTCVRNQLGQAEADGRRRPVPVEGSEFVIEADAVVPAIGQRVDAPWAEDVQGLTWSRRRTLEVDPLTYGTGRPDVFAGGDAVTGPATVIEAVAAGRRAALSMHRFIQGLPLEAEEEGLGRPEDEGYAPIPDGLPRAARPEARSLDPAERLCDFSEVETGLAEEEARSEAARCLNCGGCSECLECVRVCEAAAIDHHQKEEILDIKVGSIILATGYDLFDPTPLAQYGYGRLPNVFTALEFERLSNATGPTGGRILLRGREGGFADPPESAAILHCVGSRDVNHHEYCSRVCCMYALKYDHLLHEKVDHDMAVYNFYIDMRCFGKAYEEFYRRCQSEGTIFIRGKAALVTDRAQDPDEQGKLIVLAEDTLTGDFLRVPVDMVILCPAMESRSDAIEVSRLFGVNQGADGFFLEEHPKMRPLNTATDGVFLAGTCQSPKDIPDTVAQASGAAAKSLALATLGRVEVPSAVSWIDPDLCAGCQTCIDLCAYSAIEFEPRRHISVVNETLCKGCGSCSGFCPSGAAQIKHFREKQIFSEIDGIFDAIHAVGP